MNFQLGDLLGGTLMAVTGILAALLQRHQTGQGQHLDIAMMEGLLAHTHVQLAGLQSFGQSLPRGGDLLSGGMPFYDVYATADGRYLSVAAIESKFWRTLCEVLALPELLPLQMVFGDDATQVRQQLANRFAEKTLAHWVPLFEANPCCVEPVLTPEEALESEFVRSRSVLQTRQHPTEGKYQNWQLPWLPSVPVPLPAPYLGENTQQVVSSWLGTEA
jgi:crotonobetainyl-CoA:carnitine CoA-transferase CaiB-like acyl-CoA transferase